MNPGNQPLMVQLFIWKIDRGHFRQHDHRYPNYKVKLQFLRNHELKFEQSITNPSDSTTVIVLENRMHFFFNTFISAEPIKKFIMSIWRHYLSLFLSDGSHLFHTEHKQRQSSQSCYNRINR